MPELPEIEAAADQLRAALAGGTIAAVAVSHPSFARRLPAKLANALAGRVVAAVERRGKHQIVRLQGGGVLVVHFRLNGEWDVGRAGDVPPRFSRVAIVLANGTRVSLADSRALSTFEFADDAESVLPRMGPEATDAAFTADALGAALARKKGAIKPALLDQRVVAGLGNIYVAEALWLAKIDPRVSAAKLGAPRRARLVKAIKDVLRRAPSGRYWMSDRVTNWRVYDREGMRCRRCGGVIRRIAQAGRSTFFCPSCQAR
jgi:formamidopyrimidine-DNA glycosylase